MKGKKKEKISIKKEELPKARRKWNRKPETQVKESIKTYSRPKSKQNARKAINNAKS